MSPLNPSITQSEDKLPSIFLSLCLIVFSHLDTEVTVHHIEAGQQRRDEVGLVASHEGRGLIELCQHLTLAHQQTKVVSQFFLKDTLSVTEAVWDESETREGSVKGNYCQVSIRDTS